MLCNIYTFNMWGVWAGVPYFIVSFNYLLYKTPNIGKSPRLRGKPGHESSVWLSGMYPLYKFYFLNSFTTWALGKCWNEGPYWQRQDWEIVLEKCFTPTAKTILGKIYWVPWWNDMFFPRYIRSLSEIIIGLLNCLFKNLSQSSQKPSNTAHCIIELPCQ